MSEIDNKIRADLFRKRIEDKNTLTGAGAIYVGKGIPQYISSTGEITGTPSTGTTGPFYETVGVTPTSGGQVPVSVMGTGSAEATGTVAGLEFKSVNDAMKDVDGNIALDAKGFNLTATGTMNIESNVCNLTATGSSGSFVNVQANRINLKTYNVTFGDDSNQTTLNNVGEIGFQSGSAVPPYVAPSGTLDQPGGTPYPEDTDIYNLKPIISNISARLDRLGFKTGTVYDPSGTVSILQLTKIGYYVLATLLQSITLDNGVTSYWFETGTIPEDFRRLSEKPDAKELFVLKTDYMITTGGEQHSTNNRNFAIEYMGEHTFQFNADYISSTGVSYIRGIFNKGTTFGYDIRE